MAPKKRAAVASASASTSTAAAAERGGKKAKQEPETPQKPKDASTSAKEAVKEEIYKDYDCMLNQTNISNNNNKFYVIQVIEEGTNYYTRTRWGRVGERGKSNNNPHSSLAEAVNEFEEKFKEKTNNNWNEREKSEYQPGKYTLIEVDGDQDAEVKMDTGKRVLSRTVDKSTEKLMELIFSNDMFKEALDIIKMPLGNLSTNQIKKGFDVLEEIEAAINQNENSRLEELSSKFFTTIPHNFGRKTPLTINSKEIIEQKKEMLMVLTHIKLAQTLKSETKKAQEEMTESVPHLADQLYTSLKCKLSLVDRMSETYKIIEKYFSQTKCSDRSPEIINVWEIDRETEREHFSQNDRLENRRLLWHCGTIAVVVAAAILEQGLRITPYSGGRVGRGIYFASEMSTAAKYVAMSKDTGIMFLNEVALGEEFIITRDDSSLEEAPNGYDSVVARGLVEPDPSQDVFITLDGKQVAVPQGPPIPQSQYQDSHFSNSEYLIYKESQCRMRYLLELHMR